MLEILQLSYELYQKCFLSYFDVNSAATSAEKSAASDGLCSYVVQDGPFAGRRCRNKAVGDTGYCNTHREYAKTNVVENGSLTQKPVCYLGGGTDFTTKTIERAIFAEDNAQYVEEVSHILYEQFPTKLDERRYAALKAEIREVGFSPRSMSSQYKNGQLKKAKDDHRHWCDRKLGVSPHTVKMGRVGDKIYLMGKCCAEIEELT